MRKAATDYFNYSLILLYFYLINLVSCYVMKMGKKLVQAEDFSLDQNSNKLNIFWIVRK